MLLHLNGFFPNLYKQGFIVTYFSGWSLICH